jgi:hypothetical protein
MRNFSESTGWKLFISCIVLTALVLLAIGLQDIHFRPSQSINLSQPENDSRLPTAVPGDQVIIVITILIMLAVILLLFRRDTRKGVLVIFSCLIALIFTLYLISNASRAKMIFDQIPGINNPLLPTPGLIPQVSQPPKVFQPPSMFHPPQVSNLILYLVSFAIISLFIFTASIIYRGWRSRSSRETRNPLEGLGEAARLALDDLAAGLDGIDSIILCYARMSEVIMQKRNMERGVSRTASEFAMRLESAGLPADSVHRLTRLFESARYGAHESQPVEIEEAKACLTDIARYCGEAG